MTEHAERRSRQDNGGAKAALDRPAGGPEAERLNRRSEAKLGPARRMLEQRSMIAPASTPQNRTGLPEQLKAGAEALSGQSLDDVRVHRNSSKPTEVGALAYAQGTEIHLAPGQEAHLPHEAWHVVQQKQGRVRATGVATNGTSLNDEQRLEREADVMGARAMSAQALSDGPGLQGPSGGSGRNATREEPAVQRKEWLASAATRKAALEAGKSQLEKDLSESGDSEATKKQIEIHDKLVGAGQHNPKRAVRLKALIGDIDESLGRGAGYEAEKTKELAATKDNKKVAQLAGGQQPLTARARPGPGTDPSG